LFVDDPGRDVVLRVTTAFGGTQPHPLAHP
jgi:hypothetical protein